MIFNANTTVLGSSIPMAEGYDCSYGAALALVESAQNDYAMFRAMLDVEAREMQIRNESAGYVSESKIVALTEATGKGLWTKIKELFKRLIAKIKAIVHTFVAKIMGLVAKDETLIKKYKNEVEAKKDSVGKLKIKWVDYNLDNTNFGVKDFKESEAISRYKSDSDERVASYFEDSIDVSKFETSMNEKYAPGRDNPEEKTVSEIGVDTIISIVSGFKSKIKALKESADKICGGAEKFVKSIVDKKTDEVADVNKVYEMAKAYERAVTLKTQWYINATKSQYKQAKGAFMKIVTVNPKKIEESSIFATAVAEAAEQEVDDVIDNAIDKETISDIAAATTNVQDSDVCDDTDGNCLTGGVPNRYNDVPKTEVDGEKDTEINSNVSESAYFGQLLY
jgi:hypothetical protein